MSMTIRHRVGVSVTLFALACCPPALAQKVTTLPDLTLRGTLVALTSPLGTRPIGEALSLATGIEIATSPIPTSSGGFVFKLDPATGLLARTTTTFGPAFAQRALTSGEGQVSVGVSFSATTFDKITDISLDRMQLGAVTSSSPAVARTGTATLALTSKTLAISGAVGITDNLDVAVAIPMVSIELNGTSSLVAGDGTPIRLAEGRGVFSGLGDISAAVKYRVYRFGPGLTDPGGVAVVVNMHLPTGDSANLRGLGVTRTLGSLVVSGGVGRIRPHGNVGFEWWSKGVDAPTNYQGARVSARNQLLYAAGIEVEGTPKLTLLVDFLGQQTFGAGQVGFVTDTPPAGIPGATSSVSAVALPDGINKMTLVPGLKLNLKGKLLLSVHAITTLKNNGLHATVTPVAGLDLTF